MTLTIEDLKSALAHTQEQRETLWAKVNQATGAERQLKALIAQMERPEPEAEAKPE